MIYLYYALLICAIGVYVIAERCGDGLVAALLRAGAILGIAKTSIAIWLSNAM